MNPHIQIRAGAGGTYWSVGMMPEGCLTRSTGSLPSSAAAASAAAIHTPKNQIRTPRINPTGEEEGKKKRAGRERAREGGGGGKNFEILGLLYSDRKSEAGEGGRARVIARRG